MTETRLPSGAVRDYSTTSGVQFASHYLFAMAAHERPQQHGIRWRSSISIRS